MYRMAADILETGFNPWVLALILEQYQAPSRTRVAKEKRRFASRGESTDGQPHGRGRASHALRRERAATSLTRHPKRITLAAERRRSEHIRHRARRQTPDRAGRRRRVGRHSMHVAKGGLREGLVQGNIPLGRAARRW